MTIPDTMSAVNAVIAAVAAAMGEDAAAVGDGIDLGQETMPLLSYEMGEARHERGGDGGYAVLDTVSTIPLTFFWVMDRTAGTDDEATMGAALASIAAAAISAERTAGILMVTVTGSAQGPAENGYGAALTNSGQREMMAGHVALELLVLS